MFTRGTEIASGGARRNAARAGACVAPPAPVSPAGYWRCANPFRPIAPGPGRAATPSTARHAGRWAPGPDGPGAPVWSTRASCLRHLSGSVEGDGARTGEVRDAVDRNVAGLRNTERGGDDGLMRGVIAEITRGAARLLHAPGSRLAEGARAGQRLARAELSGRVRRRCGTRGERAQVDGEIG